MVKLILNSIILLSFSVIIYIVAKTLPRVEEKPEEGPILKEHWVAKYIERADAWFQSALEKFLRRLRVWVLKFDNYVGKKLGSLRKDEKRENRPMVVEIEKKEGGEGNVDI